MRVEDVSFEISLGVSFGAKPMALATRSKTFGVLRVDAVVERTGAAGADVDTVWIDGDCTGSAPAGGGVKVSLAEPRGGLTCVGIVPGAGL